MKMKYEGDEMQFLLRKMLATIIDDPEFSKATTPEVNGLHDVTVQINGVNIDVNRFASKLYESYQEAVKQQAKDLLMEKYGGLISIIEGIQEILESHDKLFDGCIVPYPEEMTPKNNSKVCLKTSVKLLGLSTTAYNALLRSGIKTVEDLTEMSRKDLLEIRCIGKMTVDDIETKLNQYGFTRCERYR